VKGDLVGFDGFGVWVPEHVYIFVPFEIVREPRGLYWVPGSPPGGGAMARALVW
jgi:hypothetical protein